MRTILQILLILLLARLLSFFLPWWSLAPAAFIIGLLLARKSGGAFLAGFLGIFLLWGAYAYLYNLENDGLLAGKMGELLGGLSPLLMILVTAVLGGLLGGLASLSGFWAKDMVRSGK